MAPTVYYLLGSPPARSVLITARAIGLQLDLKSVNFLRGENTTPEYLKLNPQHAVPTLVEDDGFTLWDSHAINSYLVSKYAKDDSLYPKDVRKRALVDHRLHFDNGTLFPNLRRMTIHVLTQNKKSEGILNEIKESFSILEKFMGDSKYVAGEELSIADFNVATTISNLEVFVPLLPEYKILSEYKKRMNALPYFEEINTKGVGHYEKLIQSFLNGSKL